MNFPAISDQYANMASINRCRNTDSPKKNTNIKSTETPPQNDLKKKVFTDTISPKKLGISTVYYQHIKNTSTDSPIKPTNIKTTVTQTPKNIAGLMRKIDSEFKLEKPEDKDDHGIAKDLCEKGDYLRSSLLAFKLFPVMNKEANNLDNNSMQEINNRIIKINVEKCTETNFRELVIYLLNKQYEAFETKLKNESLTVDHDSTDQNKGSLSVASSNEETNQNDQEINSPSVHQHNQVNNQSPKKTKSYANLKQHNDSAKKIKV